MKRKTLIWSVIILLIVVLAGSVAYYTISVQSNENGLSSVSGETLTQTAVARQGDLIVFASGTGQLVSLDESTLQFDENGTLVELLVSVGDQVMAGDVLARLQVNKSETQRTADIAKAELALLENQQALDALYAQAEIAAAQALFDLEQAQKTLENLLNYDLELAQAMQEVADTEGALEDAEMNLYILNSSPSQDDIYTAYASMLFKEKALNELEDQVAHLEYELLKAKDKITRDRVQGQLDRAISQMYNQQIVYENALYRYKTIDNPADSLDLVLAQAQMDTAQAKLDQANRALELEQRGAPAGDIALAEANVLAAQSDWQRWKDGPDPQAVVLAETKLEISRRALELARQENLIVELVAPITATVMAIDAAVNEYVDGSEIITLADTSQYLLKVSVDETDFQSVQVGNRIEGNFDAFPDTVLTGSIVEISPSLERASGSQVIEALAVLDKSSLLDRFVLPIGLNASIDVIAGEAINAVLVPVEALHETSPGEYTVYVVVNDVSEPRHVTIGLMDFTMAQITSGLESGEAVVIDGN